VPSRARGKDKNGGSQRGIALWELSSGMAAPLVFSERSEVIVLSAANEELING
jgi:uncharacterized protein with von Willebrand factor type A (vWA) domain